MFCPQVGDTACSSYIDSGKKRPASPISREQHRELKSKRLSPIEAGRLASGAAPGESWHYDIMDCGELTKKSINEMINKTVFEIKKGNFQSCQETVCKLAKLSLCRELESFVRMSPNSEAIKNGLNLALSRAVDTSRPGMVAYLIALGADPLSDKEGVCAFDFAKGIADESPNAARVLSIIEQGLKIQPERL